MADILGVAGPPSDRIGKLGARTAVDRTARQVEQEVGDPRRFAPEKMREQLRELRPDAGQARQRGEQRIEKRGTHALRLSSLTSRAKRTPG